MRLLEMYTNNLTQDEISDYTKNTKNYLKSIAKVMDAGNVYSVDKGGPGLRQDQIATLQDQYGNI